MEAKIKIVITGATGFIGQHLLEDINSEKYIITIVTRDKNKINRVLPQNWRVTTADLTDLNSLKNAFQNQDILINLAAEVRNYKQIERTNVNGTINLIDAVKYCNIRKVIHLSSVGVTGKSYSNSFLSVNEETVCTPHNDYERTKFISETLLIEAQKKYNFNLTILRPTNVFGEFHTFNALLSMMSHIQKGKPVAYEKTALVNYVYVKDLTALICFLIESDKKYELFNVGKSESLETLFNSVATELNVKLKPVILPSIFVKIGLYLGINKIRTISNKVQYSDQRLAAFYNYPFGLKKGLQRTVSFYKEQKLLK